MSDIDSDIEQLRLLINALRGSGYPDWFFRVRGYGLSVLELHAALDRIEADLARKDAVIEAAVRDLNVFRRDKICAYGAEDVWEGKHFLCDCKYGGPSSRPGSEQTGCPELREIVTKLRAALSALQPVEGETG